MYIDPVQTNNPNPPAEQLLVVQTGFLGDVVLSTPVLDVLAQHYPAARITVLTTPAARALVEHHPAVSQVIVFDKRAGDSGFTGLFRVARKLREQRFSVVFSMHKSWRTAALLRLAGIPKRYGFAEASGTFLYTAVSPRKDLKHEVLRNLAVLRGIGLEPDPTNAKMFVGIPEPAQEVASRQIAPLLASGRQLIGIAPGSVWATKRWSPRGFADVAAKLLERQFAVVILGGKDDAASGAEIEKLLAESAPSGTVLNLVGTMNLVESAAVISRLELLVTNDSAPLHLASARGIPVVATFCATVPEFGFGPWQVPAEVVGVEGLPCRPCASHGGNTCPTGTWACVEKLTAEVVFAACIRVIDRRHAAATSSRVL